MIRRHPPGIVTILFLAGFVLLNLPASDAGPVFSPSDQLAVPLGGSTGWYRVHCNAESASVYFDGIYQGKICHGSLLVRVYMTGTPFRTFRVMKPDYETFEGSLADIPVRSMITDIFVELKPLVQENPGTSGGDSTGSAGPCQTPGSHWDEMKKQLLEKFRK
jgi:hypothetical protein